MIEILIERLIYCLFAFLIILLKGSVKRGNNSLQILIDQSMIMGANIIILRLSKKVCKYK